jgi:hypothetical protein
MNIFQLIAEKAFRNPNLFGEAIREAVFTGNEFGCYGSFDLLPEFKAIEDKILSEKLLRLLAGDDPDAETPEEMITDYDPSLFSNGQIHIAWFWDGDGTLLVVSEELKKAAINTDCKKDYGWKFVPWS